MSSAMMVNLDWSGVSEICLNDTFIVFLFKGGFDFAETGLVSYDTDNEEAFSFEDSGA